MLFNEMEVLEDISVGADPEVFVMTAGTVTSSIGLIGGTKDHPIPVVDGALQEDNVLAEFNINPARSKQGFSANIASVLGDLEDVLRKGGHAISIQTSHEYSRAYLESLGPQAMEFGCGAEFSAYTESVMAKPEGSSTTLRTAGGHVHVGYNDPWESGNYTLARMLDIVLGVPSVLLDDDTKRRSLYGSAGSLRHKPYGMEYRSLSNFWIKDTNLQHWVFDRVKWACANLPQLTELLAKVDVKSVIHTINKSDSAGAREIVSNLRLEMP